MTERKAKAKNYINGGTRNPFGNDKQERQRQNYSKGGTQIPFGNDKQERQDDTKQRLRDRVAVGGAVAAGDVVLELAFDVGEHGAGAETEESGFEPGPA